MGKLGVPKIWGVMPAAGTGTRMGLEFPKQYLTVSGQTILEHSIELLLSLNELEALTVCISADDALFAGLKLSDQRVGTTYGGPTRAESVLNGLDALGRQASEDDWVLVHDAARPCLAHKTLAQFVHTLENEKVGGILALRAKDTLKLAKKNSAPESIERTLDRALVWQAQTPQMFRYGLLRDSLRYCLDHRLEVTDEASALEHAGYEVKLIEGSATNIKVTNPEDQRLAEFVLSKL